MFYPVFIELAGRNVLVVGGGPVAEHKVESLLEAGAAITLVSPELSEHLEQLSAAGAIAVRRRIFEDNDVEGALIVISATDDPAVQRSVAAAAAARHIMVNTVDQPDLCDFIVPAIVRRGDVVAAISTSGKSPALAAALRGRLEKALPEGVARTAAMLGSLRAEVFDQFSDSARRKQVFEQIIDSGIIDWIGECDDVTARHRVRELIRKSQQTF